MIDSAICSDGAWLYGKSNATNESKSQPHNPSVGGFGQPKCSGNSMKQMVATICANTSRAT